MTTYANESRNAEMRQKLEDAIERYRGNASRVLQRIQSEVPKDRLVRADVLDFEPTDTGIYTIIPEARETLHPNAYNQLLERAEIKKEYANRLSSEGRWGWELLAHNLKTIYQHHGPARYLTRSYNGQMRGFLSSKFRRLNSQPIVESLATAAQKVGAVPMDGIVTDTRVALQVLLPRVFEVPLPGKAVDYVAFGFSWQNSDYGNGAHSLLTFMFRLVCLNGATGTQTLREVHLGGSLTDADIWSDRTLKLDTDRSASIVKDAVVGNLAPRKIEDQVRLLQVAADKQIEAKTMSEYLKKALGAGLAKDVVDVFNSPNVIDLPPGNSMWRMSNAISWLAGKQDDGDKKLELMKVAGDVIQKAA